MIYDPVEKVKHTLHFIKGDVPGLPEELEFTVSSEIGFVVIKSLTNELQIPRADIMETESDVEYYGMIKDFLKGFVDVGV